MTLGPDLILDVDLHDLALSSGDLFMDADVAQAVKIRMLFIGGEWFLNRNQGVPYFEQVFVKNPNLGHVAAIFRKTILDTPGVRGLTSFEFAFDGTSRVLTLTWAADTDEGEISDVSTFTI